MLESLPAINASLNALATVLLCAGFVLIRRKQYRAHGIAMIAACIASAVFLVLYLLHKYLRSRAGIGVNTSVRETFPALHPGWVFFYLYVVLLPHLLLAVAMLPFIGMALWHASKRQWAKHKRITRWLVWVWLYVSVTGVVIYLLLYHLFPFMNQRSA